MRNKLSAKLYSCSVIAGILLFASCSKYNYTPTPAPPPSYYDFVNQGIVYNGNLVVAGGFYSGLFNGAHGIAMWNGLSWQPLGDGLRGPGYNSGYTNQGGDGDGYSTVTAMTVYNGNLIVAGSFDSAGGVGDTSIAQWDGNKWSRVGGGFDGPIVSMTVYNGNLIAGGYFFEAGNIDAYSIAQWDGTKWSALGKGFVYGQVKSLAVFNGNLIAGGEILIGSVGNQYENGFVDEWTGTSWIHIDTVVGTEFNYVLPFNGNLLAMDGNINEWNGSTWTSFNSSAYSPFYNSQLAVYNNELIFTNQRDTSIVQWNSNTSNTFGKISGYKPLLYQIGGNFVPYLTPLCTYNGNLIVGGWFTSINGITLSNDLAQWKGNSWAPFP